MSEAGVSLDEDIYRFIIKKIYAMLMMLKVSPDVVQESSKTTDPTIAIPVVGLVTRKDEIVYYRG